MTKSDWLRVYRRTKRAAEDCYQDACFVRGEEQDEFSVEDYAFYAARSARFYRLARNAADQYLRTVK